MPATPFVRRMPPLAVRCAMGVAIHGVAGPIIRGIDAFGRVPDVVSALSARRQRWGAKRSPLEDYTPTAHDVFVAAHVKSGTNWMMQIPWASTAAPMMRRGAENVASELISPEQQQLLDRHFMTELKRLGSDFPYEEFTAPARS